MSGENKPSTRFKGICLICKESKRLTIKKICQKCAIEVSTVCKEEDIVWQGRNREYGYIMAWDHPFRWKIGYIAIYRLIYEKYLTKINGIKTYIHSNLDVHHLDHDPKHNFITNLEIISHKDHKAYHHKKGKEKILERRCICCNGSTYKTRKGVHLWCNYENIGYLCNSCVGKYNRGALFSKLFL